MIIRITLFIWGLTLPYLALSQYTLKEEIKASFDTDVIWMNEYQGLINDSHKLCLIIADDDKKKVVKTQYFSTGEITTYEDEMRGDTLILHEMLNYGRTHGALVLVKNKDGYSGYWQDEKSIVKHKVDLWPVSLQVDCGDRQFCSHYSGKVAGKKVGVDLRREDKAIMTINGKSHTVKCTSGDCAELEADRLQVGQKTLETVTIRRENNKLVLLAGKDEYILTQDYGYKHECHEKIAHDYRWTVTIPRLESPAFMTFIEDEVNALKPAYQQPEDDDVVDRDEYCQKIWVDVTLYDGKMISGYINVQKSWEAGVIEKPFVFNLEKGKVVEQEEIFNDAEHTIFDNEDIQYLVLTTIGVKGTGKWDPIYGQEVKTIPYDEAMRLCRNKGLKDWMKKYGH